MDQRQRHLLSYCTPGLALGLAVVLSGGALLAESDSEPIDFELDVWPILAEKCVTCHGPLDQFGNLRYDSKERILKGGKNGKVLVPGEPDKSPMYVRSSLPPDDLDIMPAEGAPLTKEQVEVIRKWIEQGADFGEWESAEEP